MPTANLLLFGAGASIGSERRGGPPLGSSLFDALVKFNPPGWGAVKSGFGLAFTKDFEAGMAKLATENPHALPLLQRAMAAYFFNFQPTAESVYLRLAVRLRASKWPGALATLNYERLLELSLGQAHIRPVVGQASSPPLTVELILPHGCCHLFCDGARGISGAVSFAGAAVQTDGPISVLADPCQFQTRVNGDAFPPVMSYFEPSKQTTAGASFIRSQRARFEAIVGAAGAIAIVGVRVRPGDAHIWAPLAKTHAPILYCAGKDAATEYQAWHDSQRAHASDVVLTEYFEPSLDAICAHVGIQ